MKKGHKVRLQTLRLGLPFAVVASLSVAVTPTALALPFGSNDRGPGQYTPTTPSYPNGMPGYGASGPQNQGDNVNYVPSMTPPARDRQSGSVNPNVNPNVNQSKPTLVVESEGSGGQTGGVSEGTEGSQTGGVSEGGGSSQTGGGSEGGASQTGGSEGSGSSQVGGVSEGTEGSQTGGGSEGGASQTGGSEGTEGSLTGGVSEGSQQADTQNATTTSPDTQTGQEQNWTVSYDYNATRYSEVAQDGKPYAGVYTTKLTPNGSSQSTDSGTGSGDTSTQTPTSGGTEGTGTATPTSGGTGSTGTATSTTGTTETTATIGIPSVADKNLPDTPTTESPAIIVGAAVGYEKKVGAVEYTQDQPRDAPYTEFQRKVIDETVIDADGNSQTHKKLSGYDGTYFIVRLDVSEFFEKTGLSDGYLHVKQENNNTLLAAVGMATISGGTVVDGTTVTDGNTFTGIPNPGNAQSQTGTETGTETAATATLEWNDESAKSANVVRTGSYKLSDLMDTADSTTPFLDILVFSTAAIVPGADAGKQDALTGDIPISLYVDGVEDYNESLKYDAASTDPYHTANCLGKFYDVTKAATQEAGQLVKAVVEVSKYIFKGSDLALETMVENSDATGTETTYWSLLKSFENGYYDQEVDKSETDPGSGRTVKLMSEVAVTENLDLVGTNNLRKRTLDVNSFDVQVANNTGQKGTARVGFNLKNAWLTIADKSNTTGAELAVGNNSQFIIDAGGRLIVDETCQLEVEWDGATTQPGSGTSQQAPDVLNNGMLDLRAGGTLINNGIISIEGKEGKPVQPATDQSSTGQQQTTPTERGYGEFLVREGATIINNGAMLVYGKLYNLGTVQNNGHYGDTINSNDPDKGVFSYHKGIQLAWKDDITQQGADVPGELVNGKDQDGKVVATATLVNTGDILLVPGVLTNYGTIDNRAGGRILECPVTTAIIPIEPAQQGQGQTTPTVPQPTTKRITIEPPRESFIYNYGGTIVNRGAITTATVELNADTSYGALTVPGTHPSLFNLVSDARGTIVNYGTIPGVPTIPEPIPTPQPQPTPGIDPSILAPSLVVNHEVGFTAGGGSSDTNVASNSFTTTRGTSTHKPTTTTPTTHEGTAVSLDGSDAVWHLANDVTEGATITSVDENVSVVESMPSVPIQTVIDDIAETDPDGAAQLAHENQLGHLRLWWSAYIGGELVHIMDADGNLAAGVAQMTLVSNPGESEQLIIEFTDGTFAVLGGFGDLFLDFETLSA